MTTDAITLYKLIVLYILEKVNFPMTNAQICDLMLDKEYTSYFTVQQVLAEMTEAHLIQDEKRGHVTQYTITPVGEQTGDLFKQDISAEIRMEIDAYLKDHAYELRNTISQLATYDRNEWKEYTVVCRSREKGHDILNVSFTVPTEEAARAVCQHWEEKSAEVYKSLLEILV